MYTRGRFIVGLLLGALPLMLFSAHADAGASKANNSPGQTTRPSPQARLSPQAQLAFDLLKTPEDRINIGDAALLLSTLTYPNADIGKGRATLDALAARVAQVVGGNPDPDYRIRVINTVLYLEHGYTYDFENIDAMVRGERPELRTFWYLLQTLRGSCASLPVLWYAVAERLGYPVFAVTAPQHYFLRYDDGKYRSNIETTSGGGEPSDEKVIEDFKIPEQGTRSGAYVRQLSKREFLAGLVGNEFVAQDQPVDFESSLAGMEAALQILTTSVELHWSAAFRYEAMEIFGAKGTKSPHERAVEHARTATRLGAAEPTKVGYWKRYLRHLTDGQHLAVRPAPVDVVERLTKYTEATQAKIRRLNLAFAAREAESARAQNAEATRRGVPDLWASRGPPGPQDAEAQRAERIRTQNDALLADLGQPGEPRQYQPSPCAYRNDLYGPGAGPLRAGSLPYGATGVGLFPSQASDYVRGLYQGAPGQMPGGPSWAGQPYVPGNYGPYQPQPFASLNSPFTTGPGLAGLEAPSGPMQAQGAYQMQPPPHWNDWQNRLERECNGPRVFRPGKDSRIRGASRPGESGHQTGQQNQPFCARFGGPMPGNPCVVRPSEMGIWWP